MARPTSPCCNVAMRAAYSRRGAPGTFVTIATAYECPSCGIVHQPRNLEELRTWLLEHDDGVAWTELPVYGGDEPSDTRDVWSWDAENVLVGTSEDVHIVPRAVWALESARSCAGSVVQSKEGFCKQDPERVVSYADERRTYVPLCADCIAADEVEGLLALEHHIG